MGLCFFISFTHHLQVSLSHVLVTLNLSLSPIICSDSNIIFKNLIPNLSLLSMVRKLQGSQL